MRNGKSICHCFHSLGFCFLHCKYSDSHVALTDKEVSAFTDYVKTAMEKVREFKKNRNGAHGGDRCQNQ